MTRKTCRLGVCWLLLLLVPNSPARAQMPSADEVRDSLRKAALFYRDQVASHGGYVYYYSLDLQKRWGEGEATKDQVWVQPPGTPTVGLAFLEAFEATGEPQYLEAATAAAEALVHGQLKSGGWTNCIDFNPQGDRVALYRNGRGKGKNNSTLDDGITQGAIRLLSRVDRAHRFQKADIHEASLLALDSLLAVQFPNGGFPQVWTHPVESRPVVAARFPSHDWRTERRIKNYWDMYTLNDGLAGTTLAALREAHEVYGGDKCLIAMKKLGDFLLLSQLPEPQPAWAQQYNIDMEPIWARAFEPPAVTGGESQDAMETLLTLFDLTKDPKYLAPLPSALAYLKRSLLPDGRLARYYELQTNRPFYMTRKGRDYQLTYDDSKLPDHYGWKINSRLEVIEQRYNQATHKVPTADESGESAQARPQEIRRILQELDDQNRWVSTYRGGLVVGQPPFAPGFQHLSSEVFARNVAALSRYLKQRDDSPARGT